MNSLQRLALPSSTGPLRVVQVTDCHLGNETSETLLGLNVDQSLSDVLALIDAEQSAIDLLLGTGDISCDGGMRSYQRFVSQVAQIDAPMAWLPGNHDLPENMLAAAADAMVKVVDSEHWRLVLLDSRVSGCVYGDFTEAELARLQQALDGAEGRHVLVFLHHQPVPVGSAWMDQYILRCADRFWQLLADYNAAHSGAEQSGVKGVIWGHVHQDFAQQHQGLPLWATPSTCVQFKPCHDEFAVDDTMPGYRWFELHDDGRVDTGVSRVVDKDYGVDLGSAGY